jgi:hypothetical protein
MPSSRDSFRRNRVAPESWLFYHPERKGQNAPQTSKNQTIQESQVAGRTGRKEWSGMGTLSGTGMRGVRFPLKSR